MRQVAVYLNGSEANKLSELHFDRIWFQVFALPCLLPRESILSLKQTKI